MGGEVINIDQGSVKILHRLILGLRGSQGVELICQAHPSDKSCTTLDQSGLEGVGN